MDLLKGTAGKGFLSERVTLCELIFGTGIQVSIHPKGTQTSAFIIAVITVVSIITVVTVVSISVSC